MDPYTWLTAANEEANLHSKRVKLEGVAKMLTAARGANWTM